MVTWPVAMVTGHRPQHLAGPGDIEWVAAELLRVAEKLRTEHDTEMLVSGMALGVDMTWGFITRRLRMPLAAHIPFPQQPDPWRDPELKACWETLRDYARTCGTVRVYGDLDEVPPSRRYARAAQLLHARNNGMIHDTLAQDGVCVVVLRSSKCTGGTWSAFNKALTDGVPIIRLDPDRRTVTRPKPASKPSHHQEALPI